MYEARRLWGVCKIEENGRGFIHVSELSWQNRNVQPSKVLSPSQKIKVKIINIDKEAKEYHSLTKKLWTILGIK